VKIIAHIAHTNLLHIFCGPDHPDSYVTGVGRESIALQKGIT